MEFHTPGFGLPQAIEGGNQCLEDHSLCLSLSLYLSSE